MDKLSVVILNWNGINFLKKFLPSLIQHTMAPGISLVVADNNSSDQSVEFLVSNYPNIRLIQLDENFGYAGGYNKALEQIESEYFVLLNSDVEVTKNWYQPVLNLWTSTLR